MRGGGSGADLHRPGRLRAAGHQHREEHLGGGCAGGLFHHFECVSAGDLPKIQEEKAVMGTATQLRNCVATQLGPLYHLIYTFQQVRHIK